MTGVAVTFTVDSSQVEPGANQADTAVRSATERMRGYMESLSTTAASGVQGVASTLTTVSDGLQGVSNAASIAAAGLDSMGMVVASDRIAMVAGRANEAGNVLGIAGTAADYLSQHLSGMSDKARAAANSNQALAETAHEAAVEQEALGASGEHSWAAWAAAAVGIGLVAGAIYGVVKAFGAAEDAIKGGAEAVADWTSRVSGAAGLADLLSAQGRAAAESHRLLALELGATADAFVHVAEVSRDYRVSQDTAMAGLRNLAEVLDQNNEKTKAARDTLQAYGYALDQLSGKDAPRVLDELKDRLLGVRDGAQKTADVVAILGNDGVRWLAGLADAAAKPSHAYGEADAVLATLNQRIEESNKRIAEHKTWWEGVTERVDAMITRSEEFKAKQEYALSHVTLAYRELGNTNQSVGTEIKNLWNGMVQSAEDYARLLASKIIPLQGMIKPLEVPAPAKDNRADSPEEKAKLWRDFDARKPVEDKTVEAAAATLEKLKLQKENWLTWNREREIQFWQDLQAEIFAEWSEGMSRQEIEATATWRRIEEKKAQLGRAQSQEDARPKGQHASAFEAWKNELEQRKAEEGRWFSFSREEEERFWQDKRATVAQGSREYQQVERQLLELRKEGAREGYDLLQAALKADQQAHRGDAAYQLEMQREIERNTAEHFGSLSSQHQRAILETQAAERAHQDQMKRLAAMGADARIQAARDDMDATREQLNFEREMGTLSAAEEARRLAQAESRRHAEEMARLREKRAMLQSDVEARRQADLQIEQLERQHGLRMKQLQDQEALARRNSVREWMQPVTDATRGMLQGILQGTMTAGQIVDRALIGIVGSYAQKGLEIASDWIANQIAMAVFGEEQAAEQEATQVASVATSIALSKTQALAEISAAAAAGAAYAMASVAAIPVVGWAMAPGVGAEHYATAMSFAATLAVPSAANGWMVDQDTLAMVHENERILPARYSAGLDALVEGAAGGNGPMTAAANDGSPNISLHFAPVFHGGVNRAEIMPILRQQKADLVKILDEGRRNFTRNKR